MEDLVFGEVELENKKKERMLVERNNRGHYRYKIRHATVYNEIVEVMQPYLTEEYLRQLHHPYHTQRNGVLNKSVATYALKHKTFSLTDSLTTRCSDCYWDPDLRVPRLLEKGFMNSASFFILKSLQSS